MRYHSLIVDKDTLPAQLQITAVASDDANEIHALCAAAGFRVTASEIDERTRSFDDWMHIAGWRPGDPAYAATRRRFVVDIPADRSGFHGHFTNEGPAGDFEFVQTSLFVVAVK